MARCCNVLFNLLNLVILIFSVVCLAGSFHLADKKGTDCQRALQPPLLFTGVFSLIIATLGLLGSCCRCRSLLAIYILLIFLFVLGQVALTCLTVGVTNRDTHDLLLLFGVDQPAARDSKWLQKFLWNQKHWSNIRSCLAESQICRSLDVLPVLKATDILNKEVPQILAGCCMPPANCGFRHENATYWGAPKIGQTSLVGDCQLWSNDPAKLCFDCVSCKEGVASTAKQEWLLLAKASITALIVAFLTLLIACATRRNITRDRYRRYYV